MLVEWFHIDKETVRTIITEDLEGQKLCVRFVPHVLTSEQRGDRVTSCCHFLQIHENDPEFLNKIITGDESRCFVNNLESKHQSATWVSPRSLKANKLCYEKPRIKTMSMYFFIPEVSLIKNLSQLGEQLMLTLTKMF